MLLSAALLIWLSQSPVTIKEIADVGYFADLYAVPEGCNVYAVEYRASDQRGRRVLAINRDGSVHKTAPIAEGHEVMGVDEEGRLITAPPGRAEGIGEHEPRKWFADVEMVGKYRVAQNDRGFVVWSQSTAPVHLVYGSWMDGTLSCSTLIGEAVVKPSSAERLFHFDLETGRLLRDFNVALDGGDSYAGVHASCAFGPGQRALFFVGLRESDYMGQGVAQLKRRERTVWEGFVRYYYGLAMLDLDSGHVKVIARLEAIGLTGASMPHMRRHLVTVGDAVALFYDDRIFFITHGERN